mgnify:CR=1 FL=1
MNNGLFTALLVVVLSSIGFAALAGGKSESDYQKEWCKGRQEAVLQDRTRVDCLTDTHAIEIEFANKWKNSIGQSLHYALMTGKKAGIALIIRKESDKRYLAQLERVIEENRLSIDLFVLP